jgi:membrane protein
MADQRKSKGGDAARQASSPTDIPARGWKNVAKRTMAEFKADRGVLMGAGVAFYALLGIFPALIAGLTIWGLFADPQQVQSAFDSIADVLPEQAAEIITEQLSAIADTANSALGVGAVISVAAALWAASSGVKGLITAINAAYDQPAGERSFIKERGLALALALGGILLALVAVGLLVVFPIVVDLVGLDGTAATVVSLARWPLLLVLAWVALSLLYRWAPDRPPADWGWLSWGAAIAVGIWLLASIGFTVYVQNFGNYNETYGALGGVIVLMLWLFITGVVILLGAEINAELERTTAHDTTTGPDEPMGQRGAVVADEAVGSDGGAGGGSAKGSRGTRGGAGRSRGGSSDPARSGRADARISRPTRSPAHTDVAAAGAAPPIGSAAPVAADPNEDLRRGVAVAVALGALAATWRFLGRSG